MARLAFWLFNHARPSAETDAGGTAARLAVDVLRVSANGQR
ncbi:hypothetical protein ACWCXH_39855 [Kitasatospora sp. NPDC001660]